MNAKHQFKYTYNETDFEEFSPLEVNFEMPGEINLTQMLNNFEQYLKACGFIFDGKLDFVEETYPEYLDEIAEDKTIWPADSDGWDNEVGYENVPQGGCMADFDKECGCESTSSPLMNIYKESIKESEDKYPSKPLYNKIGTIDYEVNKNKWFDGICKKPKAS